MAFAKKSGDTVTRIQIGSGENKVPMNNGNCTGAGLTFFKRESGYWGGQYPLGIQGNYDAIEKHLRKNGLKTDLTKIVSKTDENNDSGYFKVGDEVTGATLTDFADYLKLANILYESIKM